MSTSLMYAQMGLSVVGTVAQFADQSIQAKMQTMQQRYQDTMSRISAAQSMNTITANEISIRDAAVRASESIERQAAEDQANAEVSAAAAGVSGGSVNATMYSLRGYRELHGSLGRPAADQPRGRELPGRAGYRTSSRDLAGGRHAGSNPG